MTEDLPLPDLPGETPPGVEATVIPPYRLKSRGTQPEGAYPRGKRRFCASG